MTKHLFFAFAAVAALTACSSSLDGDDEVRAGYGRLSLCLQPGEQDEDALFTRALSEDAWRNAANYSYTVTDANGTVKAQGTGNSASSLELPMGSYTVYAWYGTEKVASRDQFLSCGTTIVSLSSGSTATATVNCTPTCGKAVVNFDTSMDEYYESYYVTFSTPKMQNAEVATWAKNDSEPWYLLVDAAGSQVTATIHLTPKDQYLQDSENTADITNEGTVVKTYKLLPNKAWSLNIAANYSSSKGTLGVTIEIDEGTEDKTVSVEIPAEWM